MLADMMLQSVSFVGVTSRHAPTTLRGRGRGVPEDESGEIDAFIVMERSVFENTRLRCRRDGLSRS